MRLRRDATLVPDINPDELITRDPDDDKFMLCAHASSADIVSGDRELREASGWQGVQVFTPRAFLEQLDR